MTERVSWKQGAQEGVEEHVRGEVVRLLTSTFPFWAFVEPGQDLSDAECAVRLVERGRYEALLEIECSLPHGDGSERLTISEPLWKPGEFGAGITTSPDKMKALLLQHIERIVTETNQQKNIEDWLKKWVPVGSEARWDTEAREPMILLLPLHTALRCSLFELMCIHPERYDTRIRAQALRVRSEIRERPLEAEVKALYFKSESLPIASEIESEGGKIGLRELKLADIYLTEHVARCSPYTHAEP